MDLTPIKVPRKNTSYSSKPARASRKTLQNPHRQGRPLKRPEDVKERRIIDAAAAGLVKDQKKRSLKNLKSKRQMSTLEKLPVELLQHIFLYSLNLDLARSSPVIAGKLTSSSVYLKTVIAAFGPTWETWHGRARDEPRVLEDDSGADVELQSAILRCRWASLEIFLQAKDSWLQTCRQPRAYIPIYFDRGPPIHEDEDNEDADTDFPSTASEYFERDFEKFCDFANDPNPTVDRKYNWNGNTDVSDSFELPYSLLAGPWNEKSVRLLFWLVKAGARIDWINSTIGEVGITGLRAAIMDGDVRVVHLLQWAGLSERLDMDVLIWSLHNAGGNKTAVINHLLKIGFTSMSDSDVRKLGGVLLDIRDEAIQEVDEEKLAFFHALRESEILRHQPNLYI